ncbi:hypothetical protein [Mucilaginibacter sp. 44-25]|uniref:hypothetical protein n=1 Tax=Mucilaginibacter sp. 44-25 TaxID=1895794 RepID=UPI0025D07D3C|nr:hypothetical protein [Mucilaginibacter sp. 44-25]
MDSVAFQFGYDTDLTIVISLFGRVVILDEHDLCADFEPEHRVSLEGMDRWNSTQSPKAGWGAFYFKRDYNNGPLPFVRRSIQAANQP